MIMLQFMNTPLWKQLLSNGENKVRVDKVKATVICDDTRLMEFSKKDNILVQKAELVFATQGEGLSHYWAGCTSVKQSDYPRGQRVVCIALNEYLAKAGVRIGDQGYVVFTYDSFRECNIKLDSGLTLLTDPIFFHPIGPKVLSFDHPEHKISKNGPPKERNQGSNRKATPSEDGPYTWPKLRDNEPTLDEKKKELESQKWNFDFVHNEKIPQRTINALCSTHSLWAAVKNNRKLYESEFYKIIGENEDKWLTIPGWRSDRVYNEKNPWPVDKFQSTYALCTMTVTDADKPIREGKRLVSCQHKHTKEVFAVVSEETSVIRLETAEHVEFCVPKGKVGYDYRNLYTPLFDEVKNA